MARYEGMDEILQRVRDRLGRAEVEAPPSPPSPPPDLAIALGEQHYLRLLDHARILQAHAEQFRELLSPDYLRTLAPDQHDYLLSALGRILQELWGVESALQRRTPYD